MASGAKEDEVEITGEKISGYDPKKTGTQTITVTYLEETATFTVTVVDETIGISMNTNPDKTEYTKGENIDLTGATINVTKSSGITQIPVTKEMISGYDKNKVGTQTITVTYDGATTEFIINVKPGENKPSNPVKPTTNNTTYTVTFVNYDGEVLKTEKVQKGKSATAPEVEERTGYKFIGWNKEFNAVEEDITVMAEYEKTITVEVIVPEDIEVSKGEKPNLEDVTLVIKDEGEIVEEVPVTEDMLSGFDSEKVGSQEVTVTYVDEEGNEYTATFEIRVLRPIETLGVEDEQSDENSLVLPIAVGTGITAMLLAVLAWASRKNVEIYALKEDERKLIGKQKISKNNTRIELDKFEKELENSNIEIVLNKNIAQKLNDGMVDVIYKGKKATYKVKTEDGQEFSIKMRNM